ncbi:hypothetical protein D3OALGA1CA_1063 [Olavius algarvensis associated proteobacterium Delta 3]|nr:hypothetical protein D3OALGA1CA_1063 [Olavius algarvensis associated proteobacterium Delta 3]
MLPAVKQSQSVTLPQVFDPDRRFMLHRTLVVPIPGSGPRLG